MIKIEKSDRLNALGNKLDDIWNRLEEEEPSDVKEALSDMLFPGAGPEVTDLDERLRISLEMAEKHKHAWLSDNDWQSMVDVGDDMFRAGVRISSLLKRPLETIFEVSLGFGGEIDESSTLFLSGTEDVVAALLEGVIDQFG